MLPLKVTVPLLWVNVPLLVQSPVMLMAALAAGLKMPAAAMVTILKVEPVAGRNCPSLTARRLVTAMAPMVLMSALSEGVAAVLARVRL